MSDLIGMLSSTRDESWMRPHRDKRTGRRKADSVELGVMRGGSASGTSATWTERCAGIEAQ